MNRLYTDSYWVWKVRYEDAAMYYWIVKAWKKQNSEAFPLSFFLSRVPMKSKVISQITYQVSGPLLATHKLITTIYCNSNMTFQLYWILMSELNNGRKSHYKMLIYQLSISQWNQVNIFEEKWIGLLHRNMTLVKMIWLHEIENDQWIDFDLKNLTNSLIVLWAFIGIKVCIYMKA